MKRIYFITIAFLALAAVITMSSFESSKQEDNTQTIQDGYVLVRSTEIYGMMPSSLITIYEDGTVEKVALKKLNAKSMEENLKLIHSKLTEIKNKGYKLVSSSGGSSDNIISTSYIFEKIK